MAAETLIVSVSNYNNWARKSFADLFSSTAPVPSPLKSVSSYKCESAIIFKEEKISSLAAPSKLCLIGMFSQGKPSTEALRKDFHTIGFKGYFSVGWLDPWHVLICLDLEEDCTSMA